MISEGLKLELHFIAVLSPQKEINSFFCGDVWPAWTADLKSTIYKRALQTTDEKQ